MNTKTVKIPRVQYREFRVELDPPGAREAESGELYPISFSSELPIKRWSWDGPYYEILSHIAGDVDLERATEGLPVLKSHDRKEHCGSVTGITLDAVGRKLRGMLGFSSIALGVEQKTMVDEGHLRTVSVGYEITGMLLEQTDADDVPTYRCTWTPLEVSPTPVPADFGVGFGREDEKQRVAEDSLAWFEVEDPAADGGEARMTMKPKVESAGSAPEGTPVPDVRAIERDYGAEAAEIAEICTANGRADRVADFIREKVSPGQVARIVLEEIRTSGPAQPASESLAGVPERDIARYSIQRALRIAGGMEKRDGMEAEVHDELISRGGSASNGGILVPWRLRNAAEAIEQSQRALGTGEATGGATLVGEQVMPDMIDLLRNKTRVIEFGARLYPGLQGVVNFNRKTTAPTVEWMAENPVTGATGSQATYGYVTMSPKTLIGMVEVPRQLLTMASIDVEADIRSDLAIGHALAIDLAALHGSGTDKQPVGIYSAADVQAKAFGGIPTLTTLTDCVGLVADENADFGALAFMTTPLMAALLSRTPLIGSTYPKFIWDGKISDGEVIGYKAGATSQVSKTLVGGAEHGLIFGNWNQLMVGLWGNDLELVVDEVTLASKGQIKITSFSMGDVAIRRPKAFVKGTGATIV